MAFRNPTVIGPGSITSDELADGSVTTAKIALGAVTADTIAADAVTAGTIAADALNGKTIVGSTIETAETGERIVIAPSSVEGVNAIELYSGDTGESTPAQLAAGVDTFEFISLTAPKLSGDPAPAELMMQRDVTLSTDDSRTVTLQVLESSGLAKALVSVASTGTQIIGGLLVSDLIIGPFPRTINGLDFGTFSGKTDSNGNIAIAHNLGVTPIAVFVQMGNHGGTIANILSAGLTGTTFTAKFINTTTGNSVASGASMDGYYLALA